jgi:hypothetical protein
VNDHAAAASAARSAGEIAKRREGAANDPSLPLDESRREAAFSLTVSNHYAMLVPVVSCKRFQ